MTESIPARLARYRKALTAAAGAASLALSQGLIQGAAAKWTALAISALTALGVYQVANG